MPKLLLKGEFLKNETIQKKDGTKLLKCSVLVDDEVVQISNCHIDAKRMQSIEMNVNVKNSEYGLYVTPVQE